MNIKYLGAGVVLAILLGVVALFQGGTPGPVGPAGADGTSLGSVAGPDIMSPYFSYGGVRHWGYSTTFNQASTTLCDFTSPAGTSTLAYAIAKQTTGTSTAIAVEWGKSANPTATTTSLGYSGALAASAQYTAVASTSPSATAGMIDPSFVFKGGSHLVFKYGGAQGALNVLVGTCKAVFIESN